MQGCLTPNWGLWIRCIGGRSLTIEGTWREGPSKEGRCGSEPADGGPCQPGWFFPKQPKTHIDMWIFTISTTESGHGPQLPGGPKSGSLCSEACLLSPIPFPYKENQSKQKIIFWECLINACFTLDIYPLRNRFIPDSVTWYYNLFPSNVFFFLKSPEPYYKY